MYLVVSSAVIRMVGGGEELQVLPCFGHVDSMNGSGRSRWRGDSSVNDNECGEEGEVYDGGDDGDGTPGESERIGQPRH